MANLKPSERPTCAAIPKPSNRKPTLIFKMPVEEEIKRKEKEALGRYCIVSPREK